MKRGNGWLGFVGALVLVAVALWVAHVREQRKREATAWMGQALFPEMNDPDRVNRLQRMVFESLDGRFEIVKDGDQWIAPGRKNYPVNFDFLRPFLLGMANLNIGQVISDDPAQFASMQLADPGQGLTDTNAVGMRMIGFDDEGRKLFDLIAGKAKQRTLKPAAGGEHPVEDRYIAVGGKAMLMKDLFPFMPNRDHDWFETPLVSDAEDLRVESVTVNPPDGNAFTLQRVGLDDWIMPDLAEGESVNQPRADVLGLLPGVLCFDDLVDPDLPDAITGFDRATRLRFTTDYGVDVVFLIGNPEEGGTRRYVRYEVHPVPDAEWTPEVSNLSTNTTEAEWIEQQRTERTAWIEQQNERIAKWAFLVTPFSLQNMTFTREEFVETSADVKTP